MGYHTVTKEEFNNLYPNKYDFETLMSYGLWDKNFNTAFLYYYSCYRYFLEDYLKTALNLKDIEDKINEEKININIDSIYKDISNLGLGNIFIKNNIFFERLTLEEFNELKNYYELKDVNRIKDFVIKTYKRLILFDFNLKTDDVVNYDPLNGSMLTFNNSLVIGIFSKKEPSIITYLKEKEKEYANILGIPVSIFIISDKGLADSKIELNANLNLDYDLKTKAILKQYPKYLPLGSVVALVGGWKKIMIMGYSAVAMNKQDEVYDYIGCLYPEGVILSDHNILFNHDDIRVIYAIGLIDDEEQKFMENIDKIIASRENKKEVLGDA